MAPGRQGWRVTVEPTAGGGDVPSAKLDSSVPQTARIWNHLLGGKDNFAADRAVGDQIIHALPQLAEHARLSRRYLARAVRHPATDYRPPGLLVLAGDRVLPGERDGAVLGPLAACAAALAHVEV